MKFFSTPDDDQKQFVSTIFILKQKERAAVLFTVQG